MSFCYWLGFSPYILYCQLVLRISGNMLRKNTSQCKIPIVPEEGWFGQSKYSNIEHRQKTFYVVSVSLSKRTATSLRFRCSYV